MVKDCPDASALPIVVDDEGGQWGEVDEPVAIAHALALLAQPALQHPEHIAEQIPFAARPPIEFPAPWLEDKMLKVNFDFWSHSSGLQRAYLACPYHKEDRCIKYRFVHLHPSYSHCTAWMLAWAEMGGRLGCGKHDHLAAEPDAAAVQAYPEKL